MREKQFEVTMTVVTHIWAVDKETAAQDTADMFYSGDVNDFNIERVKVEDYN